MKSDFEQTLQDLVHELEKANELTKREEYHAAYQRAIELSMLIQAGEYKYIEKLTRYVNDSLPWTESVLSTFNRFEKVFSSREKLKEKGTLPFL